MICSPFIIRRHDRLPILSATLHNADDVVVDLTGATVRFHMRAPGASVAKVNALATVLNATGGRVAYSWSAADVDTAGRYDATFQATMPDGKIQSFPNLGRIVVIVTDDLTTSASTSVGLYDFNIEQGTTWRRTLEYQDQGATPITLAGYGARMHIRRTHASTTLLADLTTANGGITITGSMLELELTANQTAALPRGRSVYDVEIIAPSGDVTRLIEGAVIVSPEVTQ